MPSNNWKYKPLNEVASRIMEKNGERTNNVLTISAQHGLVSQIEYFNKSVASKNLSGYYYLTKGDFAYNKSYSEGYPFGAIKQLEKYDHGVVSTLYICFRLNSALVDSRFYKQYFGSGLWNSEVRNIAQEGGRSHGLLNVGVKEFFEILVPVPSLEEQQKIASILSSVDEAIEKTEAIIEQTEKVKNGLMQQLLQKGIGHTKFKGTEIGEIPEEWEIRALGTIGSWSGGGTPSKKEPSYWSKEKQVIWVSPKDMYSNIITSSEDFITEKGLREKKLKLLPKGTILFVTRSGILRKRVPIAVAGDSLTINQDLKALQVASNIDYEFIFYALLALNDSIRTSCVKTGTTVESIDFQSLQEVLIPVPPLSEQREIVKIIGIHYKKLENEKSYLKHLHSLKKGLMQSLLTGKVRVKVEEAEVTQV